jgi:peroxiredoxin
MTMRTLSLLLIYLFVSLTTHAQFRQNIADKSPLLNVGDHIPNVTLKTMKGEDFNLQTDLKDQATIIIFYRAQWCPYCNEHLSELQEYEKQFIKLGYKVIAISSESPDDLALTKTKTFAKYLLLSDEEKKAIQGFGVENGNVAIPSVFIIDKKGTIKYVHSNPDYKVRLSGAEVYQQAKNAMK